MKIGVMKDSKTKDEESTHLTYTGLCHSCCHTVAYTLRDVSFTEVGSVCRMSLREPMNLCTDVSEGGVDGETTCSETPSLLSYTLRYVSFSEVGSVCPVALREPMHLYSCVSEEGGEVYYESRKRELKTRLIYIYVCSHIYVYVCISRNFVYYESIKRELKIKSIYEYRCDERLKAKAEKTY
jgi:hypothetical protein